MRTDSTGLDAGEIQIPTAGGYGGRDHGIPLDQVEEMQQKLRAGATGSHIVVYPDAGYAFFADYRPNYRESDARDAWSHMLAWFQEHGVA